MDVTHTPALQCPGMPPVCEHLTDANMPRASQQAPSLESGVHCLPDRNLQRRQ